MNAPARNANPADSANVKDGTNSTDLVCRFWCDEKLRNADTDRQGHINNAVMGSFFEAGRIEILDAPQIGEIRRSHAIVVARVTIDYLQELFYPGQVRVGTNVTRVGTSSMTFEQHLVGPRGLAARAESICVLIDRQTRRPSPIPQAMRDWLMGT
ncbi:MAG: acyl-CoA thioesterase [Burkholderiaceae bacterium]